jgi:hypothetical protein
MMVSMLPPAPRAIPQAPENFDGTVADFYEQHIVHVLPSPQEVSYWHEQLVAYASSGKPLPVRYVSGTTRGEVCQALAGGDFKPTDNSPAWWMHFVAFHGVRTACLDDVPSHMFETARLIPRNISTAGWHVAHILNAKDRNTDWQRWTRADVAQRFFRNMHPCNCFYVPTQNWRQTGGQAAVIGYVACRYADRYAQVWPDFMKRAGTEMIPQTDGSARLIVSPTPSDSNRSPNIDSPAVAVSYRYSRLCFRADVIEPLGDDDLFEVVTPQGRFRLTKADFHRSFPQVIKSNSYCLGRIYHYPRVPALALRFRVPD